MTERELLEMAAKAAGIEIEFLQPSGQCFLKNAGAWNPLDLDDDALRLMVKLRLCVEVANGCTTIGNVTWIEIEDEGEVDGVTHGDDPYAATRRAIVRAAAEIGKAMS